MKSTATTARLIARSRRPVPSTSFLRPFSSTPSTLAANPDPSSSTSSEEPKQKAKPDEPDTTVPGRSPFQAFVDVMRDEIRKNREFQESVKQLQGEASKVQDSEAMKKAKDVYERARVCLSTTTLQSVWRIRKGPELKLTFFLCCCTLPCPLTLNLSSSSHLSRRTQD